MAVDSRFPSLDDVRPRIIEAIVELYRHDRELLDRDANERSITHKLAEHLQDRFSDWSVDCEYNRVGRDPKRLELPLREVKVDAAATEAQTVFPDIIIHHRGTNQNLVVIEVKKIHGVVDTRDKEKVAAFSRSPQYRYQHGLILRLGVGGDCELSRYQVEADAWEDWSEDLRSALKEQGNGG